MLGAEGGIFLSLRKQPTGLFAAKADVADACRLWSLFQIPPQMKNQDTRKRVLIFGAEGGIFLSLTQQSTGLLLPVLLFALLTQDRNSFQIPPQMKKQEYAKAYSCFLAQKEGFEPSRRFLHTLLPSQGSPFGHLGTSA